ncbi:MAG: DNA-processing protein DprA [Chloroflexales bacterium]
MSVTSHILHPDTQAILLLCGSLGRPRASESPLTLGEYNQVAQWLQQQDLRPANLLEPEGITRVQTAGTELPLGERVVSLVARGTALALAVENWTHKGLWVVGRSDPRYPQRLRTRLGRYSPPILYGVGERSLLDSGGLAIVGSRDADEEALDFTRAVSLACARQGVAVVSGGARGVDSEAMQSALDCEGIVLGVLADSLARAAVAGKYRPALRAGRMVLVSPYDPEAGFNTGNAMNRNKAIYALSDFALVVSASLAKGGTWEGAIENLRRSWVPLFVRSADPHSGNQRLIEKGGNAVDRTVLTHTVSLDSWLNGRDLASATPLPFDSPTQPVAAVVTDMIVPAPAESAPARPNPETVEPVLTADRDDPTDLFPIVWPHIKRALAAAHTEREVAELFQLEIKQTQIWLRRALDLGHVRKLNKPVRYVAEESSIQALPLFDSHDED